MMQKKKLLTVVASTVAVLLLAATAAITQNWQRQKQEAKKEVAGTGNIMDEEDTGITLNDDPWREMEKLVDVYYGEGKKQVNYSGTMTLTDDSDDEGKLLEEQVFEYAVNKGDFYYKIGPYECVSKEKFVLMVDHQLKSISVSPVRPGNGTNDQAFDMAAYSKLMQHQETTVKLTQTSTGRVLTIDKIQDPSIQGFSIHYDPATYQISKIVIGMLRFNPVQEIEETTTNNLTTDTGDSEEGTIQGYLYKLTISYENTSIIPGSTAFTPENKFIRIKESKIELAPGYGEYQLMD